jgi:hypothetical protein
MQEQLSDGVYFGLDADVYHAQHRLSPSGMTNMIEGPSAWWARSWLNPDYEDRKTDAMILGSAYHCARLEPEAFMERYYRKLDKDDYGETLLTTDTAVKARLKDLGQTQAIAGELATERAQRLLAADPDALIWSVLEELYKLDNEGKQEISADQWEKIARDARNFRTNPEIEALVSGGAPEVSILYTCPNTGAPMKTRPDYLAPAHYVDLKTWDMKASGKPGNRAIIDAFCYNGYHRSAWTMLEGLEEARIGNLPVHTESESDILIMDAIRGRKAPLDCWFIFQRRGGVPDIRARKVNLLTSAVDTMALAEQELHDFETEPDRIDRKYWTTLGHKAELELIACKKAFLEGQELYSEGDPWFPRDIMGEFYDEDFRSYWLDSVEEPR